ncbi:uncharacterized protein PSFLO_00593 [Pseudozyma flocculosa]|uniref:Uncharacterized protein n=1 Tax=Pseudozyma flocculosa TaxID=84751 RepID=A0A5C3ESV0_9BASI|nr:uncharacterized protein PSFLO_00593 [Pseudozyma flocculosa]
MVEPRLATPAAMLKLDKGREGPAISFDRSLAASCGLRARGQRCPAGHWCSLCERVARCPGHRPRVPTAYVCGVTRRGTLEDKGRPRTIQRRSVARRRPAVNLGPDLSTSALKVGPLARIVVRQGRMRPDAADDLSPEPGQSAVRRRFHDERCKTG